MTDQENDASFDSRQVVPKNFLIPFVLVTFCFALWGFANDITNPLVKGFGNIFNQSTFISAFVQFAFYGGYCFMAIPAAIFIKRFTYKSGILLGLVLYAAGGMLFIPASQWGIFWPFCAAFFIMTCGLSFRDGPASAFVFDNGSYPSGFSRVHSTLVFTSSGSSPGG